MNDYQMSIDNILKQLLQKNIKFVLNDQVTREGKLILFNHGYFTLNFHIKNHRKNKNELFKLPIPFDFEYHDDDGLLYFDYRIKTFAHGNEEIETMVKGAKKTHLSKYYDKILIIEEMNEK
jgi:hypothetical protein